MLKPVSVHPRSPVDGPALQIHVSGINRSTCRAQFKLSACSPGRAARQTCDPMCIQDTLHVL